MKTYSFAPISARDYPSAKILCHPYIWGGVQFCVNLSEKPYSPELVSSLAAHGIDWIHCPLSENPGSPWLDAFAVALPQMYKAYQAGSKQVVHCDFGANRSRTLIEAFHYLLTGREWEEEYKGELNHLAYNCIIGHLPPLQETEDWLKSFVENEEGRLV